MVVHYHKPECYARGLVCYLQGQSRSEAHVMKIWLFLLYFLNRWSFCNQTSFHFFFFFGEKMDCCVRGENKVSFSGESLSFSVSLSHSVCVCLSVCLSLCVVHLKKHRNATHVIANLSSLADVCLKRLCMRKCANEMALLCFLIWTILISDANVWGSTRGCPAHEDDVTLSFSVSVSCVSVAVCQTLCLCMYLLNTTFLYCVCWFLGNTSWRI